MKRIICILSVSFCIGCLCQTAGATILDFENISTQLEFRILEPYGELNWENVNVRNKNYSPLSGFNDHTRSGEYIAYNHYGYASTISDGLFNVFGAYFAAAWTDDLEITATGFYGHGESPVSKTFMVSTGDLVWLDFNFFKIESLTLHSAVKGGADTRNHFLMDDFTYEKVPVYVNDDVSVAVPTPEPGTMSLIIIGIVGLLTVRWYADRGFNAFPGISFPS